jgi:Cu-Zn family superoxide dismutase
MNKNILAAAAAAAALVVTACATTPVRFGGRDREARADEGQHDDRHRHVRAAHEQGGRDRRRARPRAGEHGFHMHEKGDCSSGDGMSTGGHWNPDSTPHGPQAGAHHAGDMPSLVADAGGNAKASFSLDGVTVAAGPKSVVGRA